ncbi:nucleotidyltransferase family protein [Candidatus Poriferisodalis sp.]|uniref:nucleotidyltransferase family protein n=1 Tax=Candidatus Poriferisodalis sp. TaxID=3101277 RepID=UPI003B52C9EC
MLVTHRAAIRRVAKDRKATSIALIGSVARGEDTDNSDYDFLVAFATRASLFDMAGLQLDLEALLGGDVDVVSAGGLTERHSDMLSDAIVL